MPDFLKNTIGDGPALTPLLVLVRLLGAMAAGGVVVLVYRRTRSPVEQTPSFPPTLLLMTILIAMATQVIGDNVARAFSLVGALSIVRFRTVVRDTLDTAFVIFAVVVGMAAGADQRAVAVIGLSVVAAAAFLMRTGPRKRAASLASFLLNVRVGLGQDMNAVLGPILDTHLAERRLLTMATAKQGVALDVSYEVRFRQDRSADELVKALNLVDGVQSVELSTREAREEVLG